MKQTGNTPINSDKDLLSRLGFTEKQASNISGITQEAMEKKGVLPSKVAELRMFAYLLGFPVRDDAKIIEYVRFQHGEESAEQVREAFSLMAAPLQFETLQELWVVLPDIRHMIKTGSIELLRDLLSLPSALTFMTGGPLGQRTLQEFFGEELLSTRMPPISFKSASAFGAQSTMLLGDPLSENVKLYYPGKHGWVYAPIRNAASMAAFLKEECR